jgi:phospholipid/cholesterol/gamma-HCH transport system permease protein
MNTQPFITFNAKNKQYICAGDWIIDNTLLIEKEIQEITWPSNGDIILNGEAILEIDSSGAWLLNNLIKQQKRKKNILHLKNFSESHRKLLDFIEKQKESAKDLPKYKTSHFLARLGERTITELSDLRDFLNFIGQLTFESLRGLRHPTHIRFKAIINVLDKAGYQALPIIALLSFMIGVVIAYQMGTQLKLYGANIFIVDLLGLSILREFGPLLTAIMVAGRTGSAFTAQLGIMKINQEIDALTTMGVTPAEILLLPRMVGLFIAVPLLTMWANLFGIIGGMVMTKSMLDISWYDFLLRFHQEIPLRALLIGLGKAPVFALIIGSIACYQGMQVHGSAESVGTRTTRSVVLAIFFVIITDAIFSIIFNRYNL